MTPAGIEPATFRFVAQHLNHCDTVVIQLQDSIHLKDKGAKSEVFNSAYHFPKIEI